MQRPSQFPKIDNRSSHAPAPQVLGSLSSNTTDITERRLDTSFMALSVEPVSEETFSYSLKTLLRKREHPYMIQRIISSGTDRSPGEVETLMILQPL